MTGGAQYAGAITVGDLDPWTFTACAGDPINLVLTTTNFYGQLELFGPNGARLQSAGERTFEHRLHGDQLWQLHRAGQRLHSGGTGTYGLTANGLSDALRVCQPSISGQPHPQRRGGPTNAGFVLYSTTNVATPFGLWTPALTNQFDQFGVLGYTNIYNPAQRQQFFRFRVP